MLKYANIVSVIFSSIYSFYINSDADKHGISIQFTNCDCSYIDIKNHAKVESSDDFNSIESKTCSLEIFNKFEIRENIEKFSACLFNLGYCNDKSFDWFSKYLDDYFALVLKNKDISSMFLLFKNSIEAVKKHNFDISIVLSFFIIERVLKKMWFDLLTEKQRKSKLKDDKSYTVAVISNILYFNNIMSKELLDKIDSARMLRNQITHNSYDTFFADNDDPSVSYDKQFCDAGSVFSLALELFNYYYKLNIRIQYGIQL